MRTILVPTDFSKLSKIALSYAIGLAKKIDARVIVLSVVTGAASKKALKNWKKYEDNMLKTAQGDADALMQRFKTEIGKLNVSAKAVLGFPLVDVVEDFAVKNNVNVIVMGSKGATGLKRIVMGSNAAAVIDNSSVPVIIVPGGATFKGIKKLVYATDAKNFQKELKAAATCAEMVGASMEVLHVTPQNPGKKKNADLLISKEKLVELTNYPKIHLHVIHNDDIAKGVHDFINSQQADMLTTFTHRLDFNEKLFGKSITRKLALHNTVPLLVFNKTNQKI